MKFPIMVLTYGAFGADQKKLYIYESEGVPLFPAFHDPVVAAQFQAAHQKIIAEHGDERRLTLQVCKEPKYMRDMMVVMMSIAPDVTTIIFDPSPPEGLSQKAMKAGVKPQDRQRSFEDVIQELEDSLSTKSPSNAEKSSEHSK